jgi:osmoprotectant transport system substrate-binding protein
MRRAVRVAAVVSICVALVGCSVFGSSREAPAGESGSIVVGVSGAFPENQIVAELYAQVLERAGYTVERQLDLRSREVSQNALESGRIDLKPEYLSSLLLTMDRNARASDDPAYVAGQLKALLRPRGITVLKPSPAEDTNQFVANAQTAQRFDLTTMSSLAPVAGELTLGAPPECVQRAFCLPGLYRTYGIIFNDFLPLDVADDRHLQNAENITPVIRSEELNDEVRDVLNAVSAELSSYTVTELVRQVVIEGEDVPTVARRFLTSNDLS